MAQLPDEKLAPAAQPDITMVDDCESRQRPLWLRVLPLGLIAAGLIGGYAAGFHTYLSFATLVEQREMLKAYVADNPIIAAFSFALIYALAVAFSFPAASILTIFAGFLFGWLEGGAIVAIAATLGASMIFLAARTAFGDVLRKRAGPFIAKLADGFAKNALGYLFVLRLAPIFPFFIMNIAPAFFDIKLRTYIIATFFGILPGTFAYAWLGQGLDSVIVSAAAKGHDVSPGDLVTSDITLAFAALAVVAALPTIVNRFWARS